MSTGLRPFNSIGGFSVGETPSTVVDTNSNIYGANLSATGNVVTGGEVSIAGNASVVGNVYAANFFAGNGNAIIGFSNAAVALYLESGNVTTDIITTANVESANLTVSSSASVGSLTTSGTISAAGMIETGSTISATGAITSGGNVTGSNFVTAGTVDAATLTTTGNASVGANVNVSGNASVVGNVFAANFFTANGTPIATYSNAAVAEFLASGNLSTNVVTTATFIGSGVEATTVSASGNINGLNISLVGNVYASGYFDGNGDPIISYNDDDVKNLLASGNVNTNIITTANVNAGAVNANLVSVTGPIVTTSTISAAGNIATVALVEAGSVSALGFVRGSSMSASGNIETGSGLVVTGAATVGSLATAGIVNGGLFVGDGGGLSNIVASNISGQVANALVAGTVYESAQPNITSVGTLSSLNVLGTISTAGTVEAGTGISTTGTVQAGLFSGDAGQLSNVVGGNVVGAVASATNAAYVTQADQANITSVGTLTSLTVTNDITTSTGVFNGNGSGLSSLTGANVTGYVANADHANVADSANAVTAANVTGLSTAVNTLINEYTGDFANVGNVVTNGNLTVSGATFSAAGNTVIGGDATVVGNLTVEGETIYINITDLTVTDPLIFVGTGANGNALTANDGKDRGMVMDYYVGAANAGVELNAWLGYKNSGTYAGNLVLASNVTINNNVATVNELGSIVAGNVLAQGTLSSTGNVVTVGAEISGNATIGNANITGTLTTSSLDLNGANISTTGNVIGGNLNATNNVSAVGTVFATGVQATTVSATGSVVGSTVSATGSVQSQAVVASASVSAPLVQIYGNGVGTINTSRQGNTTATQGVEANVAVITSTGYSEVLIRGIDEDASTALGIPVVYTATVSVNAGSNDYVVFNTLGNSLGSISAYGNVAGGSTQVVSVTPNTNNVIVWTTRVTTI